ncbi:MAG: PhoH family protein, partial [Terriglobia bacterium]
MGKGIEELFGTFDENLKLLETYFQVSTHLDDGTLEIEGAEGNVVRVQGLVGDYAALVEGGSRFEPSDVQSFLRILSEDPATSLKALAEAGRPRTLG